MSHKHHRSQPCALAPHPQGSGAFNNLAFETGGSDSIIASETLIERLCCSLSHGRPPHVSAKALLCKGISCAIMLYSARQHKRQVREEWSCDNPFLTATVIAFLSLLLVLLSFRASLAVAISKCHCPFLDTLSQDPLTDTA